VKLCSDASDTNERHPRATCLTAAPQPDMPASWCSLTARYACILGPHMYASWCLINLMRVGRPRTSGTNRKVCARVHASKGVRVVPLLRLAIARQHASKGVRVAPVRKLATARHRLGMLLKTFTVSHGTGTGIRTRTGTGVGTETGTVSETARETVEKGTSVASTERVKILSCNGCIFACCDCTKQLLPHA